MRRLVELHGRSSAPSKDLWFEPHAATIEKSAERIGGSASVYDVMYATHEILGVLQGVIEKVGDGEEAMRHLEQAQKVIAKGYLQ